MTGTESESGRVIVAGAFIFSTGGLCEVLLDVSTRVGHDGPSNKTDSLIRCLHKKVESTTDTSLSVWSSRSRTATSRRAEHGYTE
jgi:hypothetical protein